MATRLMAIGAMSMQRQQAYTEENVANRRPLNFECHSVLVIQEVFPNQAQALGERDTMREI